MTRSAGCSVWLMPTGQIYEELSMTVAQLSNRYASPRFPPHITLIGGLADDERKLASQTEQLASHLRPFEVTLTTVGYLDDYFRCLFFRIEETPELLAANQAARVIFRRERNPGFLPHLSLVYGNLDPEAKREAVRLLGKAPERTFPVVSLHLYSTAGEPKDWRCLKEFEMRS